MCNTKRKKLTMTSELLDVRNDLMRSCFSLLINVADLVLFIFKLIRSARSVLKLNPIKTIVI